MRHLTPEEWDHRRDLRKHDWRPGDPPEQRAEPDEQAAYAAVQDAGYQCHIPNQGMSRR
jgi:hypothetical protein